MSPRSVLPGGGGGRAGGRARRALVLLGLAFAGATCRDAVGPRTGAGLGQLAFAPILPSDAALASFGLVIDSVRIVIIRPAADTLADTTVALPPDSSALDLDLHVPLISSPETLTVAIVALSGSQPLFTGTSDVEVTAGAGTPTPTPIPVTNYVGPGAQVDSLVIRPAAPFIYLNDSLRFQVEAFQAGSPVTEFYVAWSTSDSTVADINRFGVLRAPGGRGSVRVRARTPGGVSDSVTATFVPLPTQLVKITGDGQTGTAGQALPVPLEVEVRAVDSLPVGGVGVRFQALAGGGTPTDTTVATNLAGRAQVTGVLGSGVGAQSFQASVPAFAGIGSVTFTANAILLQTFHSSDITANETWTAAQSPHIVSAYLRIRNGATLTIEDGATVKFDSLAGLQVGDTALGEAGALVMQGTPGSIHLTANTPTPAPGFWRGIEVQKSGAAVAWRNVDIEYAGGARANPFNEACILVVNSQGAALELDSLKIRRCVHAGIHHFGGGLYVHRSQIDSVTGSGVHADFTGALRLDSTTIRGSGQEGLFFGSGDVDLVGATGNRFVGNQVAGIHLFARQLAGLGRQDSIAGNGLGPGGVGDSIVVDSGYVDTSATAFTIYRQPAPYLVTGFVNVGRTGGVDVTLDAGLVLAFDTLAALTVGDLPDFNGNTSGLTARLLSLGTADSQVVLRNRPGRPGWQGLYLGIQSGTPVVRHLRLVKGGYQYNCNCEILVQGPFEPLNANLYVDAPGGPAAFVIDSVVSDSSHFHGIVIRGTPPAGLQLKDDSIVRSVATGLVLRGRYNLNDGIAGNTLAGNGYPADVVADKLPVFGVNAVAGNVRDTLLISAGMVSAPATLRPYAGLPWRAFGIVTVDSGAVLTIDTGTVVAFDSGAALVVGEGVPSALHIASSSAAPVLLTASDPAAGWLGLRWRLLSGFGNTTQNLLRNVIVERAGRHQFLGCGDGCFYFDEGAIKFEDQSSPGVNLTVDGVIVRRSVAYAIDVQRGAGGGTVQVRNSQFYDNPFNPVFNLPSNDIGGLSVQLSDIYHYGGSYSETVVATMYGAQFDSLDMTNNWWGDVAGPHVRVGSDFGQDSLRRADLSFYAVRTAGFTAAPYFPLAIGAPAGLEALPDTAVGIANVGAFLADSLRSRVLDAFGRGVPGRAVSWSNPGGCGSLTGSGATTDSGGRAGTQWSGCTIAGDQVAIAGSGGFTVNHHVQWLPGLTTGVNFQLLAAATEGVLTGDSAVTFTSSGHHGVFVTNARDALGNVTRPSGFPDFCFTDVPNSGLCHNPGWDFPQYGSIDSVKGDSVFFTVTTASPATMQIRAEYDAGSFVDSIVINMNAVPLGMRINQDTANFGSLCPVGGPYNGFCRRTFEVQVVDSAGAALPPSAAFHFDWTNPTPGDTTVTVDSTAGVMAESVFVTAHANGTASVIALQSLGLPLAPDRDTVAISVLQVATNLKVTPDTLSVGLGDTVVFHAGANDAGGQPVLGGPPATWSVDPAFTGYLTILSQAGDSAVAQLDSVRPSYPRDAAAITASVSGVPDAVGVLYNPIVVERSGLPGSPQGSAVDPVRNRAYVVGLAGSVSVFDGTADTLLKAITVGSAPASVAVNPVTGKVYISNSGDGTVSVINPVDLTVIGTIPVGKNTGGIAVDTVKNFVYVGSLITLPGPVDVPFLSKIDGAADTVFTADTVRLRGTSAPGAVAVNPVNGRAFVVMRNDSLGVVDLAAQTLVDTLGDLGFNLAGVAVNTLTDRVYVGSANEIKVVDGAPGVDTVFTSVFIGANSAQGLSVSEARNKIYVAHSSNTLVYELDGVSNSYRFLIVGTSISDTPRSTAVNPVTGKVYVPHPSALTVLKYFSN